MKKIILVLLLCGPVLADRIHIHPQNPRYFEWNGELVFPLGVTEHGSAACAGGNGWLPISSGLDWQTDLDNMLAHGGNYARVMPYFASEEYHEFMPWARVSERAYDLSRYNPDWVSRLHSYLRYAEANGIVVQLEIWENWGFVDATNGWPNNPWNPDNNVNYGRREISSSTRRSDAAIYRAVTDNKQVALGLLEAYVTKLLDETIQYGNVIYSLHNEGNAPLEWSRYWANFIQDYFDSHGVSGLVGEMPHSFTPNIGVDVVLDEAWYDFADASSHTSEDSCGSDDLTAIVECTDTKFTAYYERPKKPITIGKIYYRSTPVLWAKFINGAGSARFHRNCNRGGDSEGDVSAYFDYILYLRRFIDEIDLSGADTIDDSIVTGAPSGVRYDVLADTGTWYAILLYASGGASGPVTMDLPPGEYTARWYETKTGVFREAGAFSGGSVTLSAPHFSPDIALLIQSAR